MNSVRDQRIFQGQEQAIFRVRISICKGLSFMRWSIGNPRLCVNKDGSSSRCSSMALAGYVADPMGRR